MHNRMSRRVELEIIKNQKTQEGDGAERVKINSNPQTPGGSPKENPGPTASPGNLRIHEPGEATQRNLLIIFNIFCHHDGIWRAGPPPKSRRTSQISSTLMGHGGNHDGIWRLRAAGGLPSDRSDTRHSAGTWQESRWYLKGQGRF